MLLHRICSLVPATVEQFRDLWREKGHQMRRDRTNKLPWRYDLSDCLIASTGTLLKLTENWWGSFTVTCRGSPPVFDL